jgi:hypothetical protein
MASNAWLAGLNRTPVSLWHDMMVLRENRAFMSVDPRVVEVNYTDSFSPVNLDQWIQVFQFREETNPFGSEARGAHTTTPIDCCRFIWYHNVLHRIESHLELKS